MSPNHDPILGIHAQALTLWGRRNEVLAANIANSDTPNYKARDIDFAATLGRTRANSLQMTTTHSAHQSVGGAGSAAGRNGELLYRIPHQPSLDGNTVEADVEQAKFGENALRYQASLMFISGRMRSLRAAIAGGHQ
ncbi:MAG: flagellar basal body rod protein FlgB [Gammaproteobacteria bacterium]|nr:flagellar basal body rod protein FlgB [Gammaproteobacteria bacterium]